MDTDFKTEQSVTGFIVGDVKLARTKDDTPMFTAHCGQQRFQRLEDGSFKRLENSYFNIVQFRGAAEETFRKFKPGDRFVASGYVREYTYTNRAGEEIPGKEFVVKTIGHNSAETRYEVDRSPRRDAAGHDGIADNTLEHEPAGRAQEVGSGATDAEPSRSEPASTTQDRGRKLAEIPAAGVTASPARAEAGVEVPF